VRRRSGALEITLSLDAGGRNLGKVLRFERSGALDVRYRWDPAIAAPDDLFTAELSVFGTLEPVPTPEADWWRHPVETLAKSERGLDRTRQGESITLRWPIAAGEAGLRLSPRPSPPAVPG
jgi:hypothetical protein